MLKGNKMDMTIAELKEKVSKLCYAESNDSKYGQITVGVEWETDGEDVVLPDTVTIPLKELQDNYEISDYLSDKYEFLVKNVCFL